jgi:hypothetical protein
MSLVALHKAECISARSGEKECAMRQRQRELPARTANAVIQEHEPQTPRLGCLAGRLDCCAPYPINVTLGPLSLRRGRLLNDRWVGQRAQVTMGTDPTRTRGSQLNDLAVDAGLQSRAASSTYRSPKSISARHQFSTMVSAVAILGCARASSIHRSALAR